MEGSKKAAELEADMKIQDGRRIAVAFVSAEETEESNNKWRALLKNGLVKLLKLGVEDS